MSDERAFLDTNVLIYAFASNERRSPVAERLVVAGSVVSVQVLNEFVSVSRRKLSLSWAEVLSALRAIQLVVPEPTALTREIHLAAVQMSAIHGYHIYDSLIVASALDAGCTVLYSEDMQDGQAIGPLTIRNPFR
jgi:predicted nucleic acid-binding protein